MEAHSHFGKIGVGRSGHGFANRKGSLLVALISAVLAGVLIYMFVSRYHTTKVAPPATETVFVAKRYIPAGTPDSTVASGGMLKPEVVPVAQAVAGAITDPSYITGEVAAAPIAVGEQVSATDFTHANVSLAAYLTGDERAISISLDSWHGLTPYLAQGNTVDVITEAKNGNEDLFQDVTVLANQGGNVTLELSDKQALLLATASDHDLPIWLTLRPVTGATNSVRVGQVEGGN